MKAPKKKEGDPKKAPELIFLKNTQNKNKIAKKNTNDTKKQTQKIKKATKMIIENNSNTPNLSADKSIDLIAKSIKKEQIEENKKEQEEVKRRSYVKSGKYKKNKEPETSKYTNDKTKEIEEIIAIMQQEDNKEHNVKSYMGNTDHIANATCQNNKIVNIDLSNKNNNVIESDDTLQAHKTSESNIIENINIFKPKSKFNISNIVDTYRLHKLHKNKTNENHTINTENNTDQNNKYTYINKTDYKLNNNITKDGNLSQNINNQTNLNNFLSLDNKETNTVLTDKSNDNNLVEIIETFKSWEVTSTNCRNIAIEETNRLEQLTRKTQEEALKYQQLALYTKSETTRVKLLIDEQIKINKINTATAIEKIKKLTPEKLHTNNSLSPYINNPFIALVDTNQTEEQPKVMSTINNSQADTMEVENQVEEVKKLLTTDPSKVTTDMLKLIGINPNLFKPQSVPNLLTASTNQHETTQHNTQPSVSASSSTQSNTQLQGLINSNLTALSSTLKQQNPTQTPLAAKRTFTQMSKTNPLIGKSTEENEYIYSIQYKSEYPISEEFKNNTNCWKTISSYTQFKTIRAYIKNIPDKDGAQISKLFVETTDNSQITKLREGFFGIMNNNFRVENEQIKASKLYWLALYVPFKLGELTDTHISYLTQEYHAESIRFMTNKEKLKEQQMSTRYIYKVGIPNEDTYNNILEKKKLTVAGDTIRANKWIQMNIVKRCDKCKHFGHNTADCPFEWHCGTCGQPANQNHTEGKNCTSLFVNCINCKDNKDKPTPHRTDSVDCPEYIKRKKSAGSKLKPNKNKPNKNDTKENNDIIILQNPDKNAPLNYKTAIQKAHNILNSPAKFPRTDVPSESLTLLHNLSNNFITHMQKQEMGLGEVLTTIKSNQDINEDRMARMAVLVEKTVAPDAVRFQNASDKLFDTELTTKIHQYRNIKLD
jgi:hypothetical protein